MVSSNIDRTVLGTAFVVLAALAARASATHTDATSGVCAQSAHWAMTRNDDGSTTLVPSLRSSARAEIGDEARLLALAETDLHDACELLELDPLGFESARVTFLPLGLYGSSDKLVVRYRQRHAGIPVEGGVSVLIDRLGRTLSIDSTAAPARSLASVDVRVGAEEAQHVALAEFEARSGARGVLSAPASLRFARDDAHPSDARELVWSTLVRSADGAEQRAVLELRISAASGAVTQVVDRLLRYDVTGLVGGWISPGVLPDDLSHAAIAQTSCSPCTAPGCGACPPIACAVPAVGPDGSPEVPTWLPDLELRDAQGNVSYSAADGSFHLPGTAPITVTLRFRGRHVNIVDAQGNDFVLTTTLTQASGNRILLGGPAPYTGDQVLTAQANAYWWITRLRHWIASVNPTDMTWEQDPFPKLARVNLPSHVIGCSGEFDLPPMYPTASGGPEVLFAIGGGGCSVTHPIAGCGCCGSFDGGCTNKANATYLVHEMGHWMNHLYLGVDAASAFNEAVADVWSMYVTGDARLFPFDCTAETCLRSGENCRAFTTYADQFLGDPHRKGEVLMGALWRVRALLEAAQPDGASVAQSLFLSWITTYPEFAIHQGIQRRWLILDDDDADPSTPTPHQASIVAGFTSHGL